MRDLEKEIVEENKQLREKLWVLKQKYDKMLMQEDEQKEPLSAVRQSRSAPMEGTVPAQPDEMQDLFEQMVEQYESEIHVLRTANEETMNELQMQLEDAIGDKEEIAESYILEIERLDLALTEAVNRITELQKKYDNLKATVAPSPQGSKYRSLHEIHIKTAPKKYITLPPNTEVICSRLYRCYRAQISYPEKYKGLVDLQTMTGKWLFEPVGGSDNKDNYSQSHDIELKV